MKGQACSMAHIAYVRVSTAEQNEARQIEALKKHGIDKWFTEKVSGKNMNRPPTGSHAGLCAGRRYRLYP